MVTVRPLVALLWVMALAYAAAVPLAWQQAHQGGPLWAGMAWGFLCGSFVVATLQAVRQGWQALKAEG